MPKISELNSLSAVSNDDLMIIVNDPGGAPSTNKITISNFGNTISTSINYASNTRSGVIKVGEYLSVNATGFLNVTAGGTGANGYTGSAGSTGFTGSSGSSGSTGFTGSTGSLGYTGSTGSSGFTGSQGNNGSVGGTGFTGSAGEIGYSGSEGLAGASGYTGSQGAAGETGFTGSIGITGYTGSAANNILVSVPVSHIGRSGDVAGTISMDANYFYYCHANYDGSTSIWRRIEWTTPHSWTT